MDDVTPYAPPTDMRAYRKFKLAVRMTRLSPDEYERLGPEAAFSEHVRRVVDVLPRINPDDPIYTLLG